MIAIFITLTCIFILDRIICKHLIKKVKIDIPDLENRYVNDQHKFVEKSLYWLTIMIIVLAVTQFHQLRIFIFIAVGITFAFRTIMQWKYAKQNRTYLLSSVTCGLFMIGTIVYGTLHLLIEWELVVA